MLNMDFEQYKQRMTASEGFREAGRLREWCFSGSEINFSGATLEIQE